TPSPLCGNSRSPTGVPRASRRQTWCLSEPQSTPANHELVFSSVIFSPFTTHGPSRRLPLLVLALEGATSYGASAVANPPGHMSRRGALSTGNGTVAPGGSARLASLRQSNQAPPTGTRHGNVVAASNRWSAAMPQSNDLSRSLVALDQNSTIIAVVELSHSSWLVAGMAWFGCPAGPGTTRRARPTMRPARTAMPMC